MTSMFRTAAGLAALVLGGCATGQIYRAPASDAPGADLVFVKGYNSSLMVSALSTFHLSNPPLCEPKLAANLLWTTPKEKTVRTGVGRRVLINVTTSYFWTESAGAYNNMVQSQCSNQASFSPQQGHTYRVVQDHRFRAKTCRLNVVDTATGRAPPDLELQQQATARCTGAVPPGPQIRT